MNLICSSFCYTFPKLIHSNLNTSAIRHLPRVWIHIKCTYVCVNTQACTYAIVSIHIHVYKLMYTYIYIYIYVCVHIYIYIHTHTGIHSMPMPKARASLGPQVPDMAKFGRSEQLHFAVQARRLQGSILESPVLCYTHSTIISSRGLAYEVMQRLHH